MREDGVDESLGGRDVFFSSKEPKLFLIGFAGGIGDDGFTDKSPVGGASFFGKGFVMVPATLACIVEELGAWGEFSFFNELLVPLIHLEDREGEDGGEEVGIFACFELCFGEREW